jgi:hypothetical protein
LLDEDPDLLLGENNLMVFFGHVEVPQIVEKVVDRIV